MSVANPFVPTFGTPPPMLAGRNGLLLELSNALRVGPKHPSFTSLLLGSRGSGKTVVLAALHDLVRERGWVSISEAAVKKGLLDRIAHHALEYLNVHESRLPPDIVEKLAAAGINVGTAYDANTDLSRRIRNVLSALGAFLNMHGTGLLLTVDELHSGDMDELRMLGVTIQQVTRIDGNPVAFIGAGLKTLEETLLSDESVTFLQRCARYEVGFLNNTDAWQAFSSPLRALGSRMTTEALKAAVDTAQGFPFMIQLVGFHTWEAASTPTSTVTLKNVRAGSEVALSAVGQMVVAPLWSGLSDVDQLFVVAMTLDEGPTRVADVATCLGVSSGYASVYRRRLLRTGLISQPARGKVTFAIEAARNWIRNLDEYPWLVESLTPKQPIGFTRSNTPTNQDPTPKGLPLTDSNLR